MIGVVVRSINSSQIGSGRLMVRVHRVLCLVTAAEPSGESRNVSITSLAWGSMPFGSVRSLRTSTMDITVRFFPPRLFSLTFSRSGYWASDFTAINHHFGTASDLESLLNAMHARGMFLMIDIVANHPGPVGTDFSRINPFNSASHYHEFRSSHFISFPPFLDVGFPPTAATDVQDRATSRTLGINLRSSIAGSQDFPTSTRVFHSFVTN